MTTSSLVSEHLGFASTGAVGQYLRMAKDMGLDYREALRSANLNEGDLAENKKPVRGDRFQAFLEHLILQANDPLLGLKSGHYVHPASYSLLGFIVMSCANIGEAILKIAPFEKLVGDMGTTQISSITRQGNPATKIVWNCRYPNPQVKPHMVDNVLASWVSFSRWLADRNEAGPLEVWLCRAKPGLQVEKAYSQFFGCPIRFHQSEDALLIDQTTLQIPLRQPDSNLRQMLESHAAQQLKSLTNPEMELIQQVRNIILGQMERGNARQETVAAFLDISSRTMQRRLNDAGTSYQNLLDEIRQEMAKRLLADPQRSIEDIAQQLGFAEPRSFHRRFKAWFGKTPGEFRKSPDPLP